jgi:hypothetical protein
MTSATERIMVEFEGEGAGEGELSWGQKEYWSAVLAQKTWGPMGGVKPLPAGTTVEEIADELRYLISRYQPMRTRLRFDAEERPIQVVFGSGQIPLEIVEAGDADPDQVAQAVADRYRNTDLDFAAEWPLRMAVVRHQGQLTHMAVLISHFATDAAGAVVMVTEVAARKSAPVAGMQPLAQADWQRSPAGRRQNDAAVRYWDGLLRTIDPRRFNEQQGDEQHPRYWHADFNSPATFSAMRAIAEGTGLESSAILLALFAVALHGITDINPVVIRPIVSNRFRPGLAEVVCSLAQGGLCVLDVADVPFDEAVRRAQRSMMRAYKHAYFDHDDLVALRNRITRERGIDLDTACYFNDRRGSSRQQAAGPAPTLRQIHDSVPQTTFRWVVGQDTPSFEPLFVHIDDVPDTIQVTLHLDTRTVSLANGEALMRGMEAVAIAAAIDLL